MANVRIIDLNPYSGGTDLDLLVIENLQTNKTEKITKKELYERYSSDTTTTFVVVMPKNISGDFVIDDNSNAFVFGEDFEITGDIEVGDNSNFYVFNPTEYQLANNKFNNVPEYLDNDDATANGLEIGKIYRTGDILKIVHT